MGRPRGKGREGIKLWILIRGEEGTGGIIQDIFSQGDTPIRERRRKEEE